MAGLSALAYGQHHSGCHLFTGVVPISESLGLGHCTDRIYDGSEPSWCEIRRAFQ